MMNSFDPNNNDSRRISFSYPQLVGVVSFLLLVGVTYVTQVDTSSQHNAARSHSIVTKQPYGGHDTLLRASKNELAIAWLMSFPNSGTSFTSKLIRHVTLASTASNYGEEIPNMDFVFDKTGPFWLDSQSSTNYTRPHNIVFTKTHCGGRCELCGPTVSTESPQSFLVQCLSGHGPHGHAVRYDQDRVVKALHLIRNPFDNIVSRFHLELHSFARKPDTHKQYSKDRNGFRLFCREVMDEPHAREFQTSRLIDATAYEILKDVPCHADFMRYVAWHNLALVVTRHHLGIPTMVLHYEEYSHDLDGTTERLLEFLELPRRGVAAPFVAGKEYAMEYFTKEERAAVRTATQQLSLMETWELLHHYFEE